MTIGALALFGLVSAATFDEIALGAVALARPQQAIAALVGVCPPGDLADQSECQRNMEAQKKGVEGKRIRLDLGANHEAFLKLEGRRPGGIVRFVWAPLVDMGNGLALTIGRPEKLSAQGNVVIAKKPFDGVSPDDQLDSDLDRAARLGQLRIEVVGTFAKAWELRAGDKVSRGVQFMPEALRFVHVRTGKVLFEATEGLPR